MAVLAFGLGLHGAGVVPDGGCELGVVDGQFDEMLDGGDHGRAPNIGQRLKGSETSFDSVAAGKPPSTISASLIRKLRSRSARSAERVRLATIPSSARRQIDGARAAEASAVVLRATVLEDTAT